MKKNLKSSSKSSRSKGTSTSDEVFVDLIRKYGKLGALIRGSRAKEGLSRKELAFTIGVKASELRDLENGKTLTMGKEWAAALGKTLNVDPRVFLVKPKKRKPLDPIETIYEAKVKCSACGKRAVVYAVKETTLMELIHMTRGKK